MNGRFQIPPNRRVPRVVFTAIAAILAGGVLASCGMIDGAASSEHEPARGIRSACNLAPLEQIEKLVPKAGVTQEKGPEFLLDPGDWHGVDAMSWCELKGTGETTLRIEAVRQGGKRSADVRARDRRMLYEASIKSDPVEGCRLQPLTGLGERAEKCRTEGSAGSHRHMMLFALKRDVSLKVWLEAKNLPDETYVITLARTVVDAL